jgi:CRISPR-associated protein Cas2
MTVLVLDKVSTALRGELSRWMLELKAGVFVGRPSAVVRDRLWQRLCSEIGDGAGCLMVTHAANEQGYRVETFGNPKREVIDFEGLQLVKTRSGGLRLVMSPRTRG